MGLYAVKVIEVSSRTVVTEAESFEEAVDKINDAWDNAKIILDYDDFDYVKYEPSNRFEDREINPICKDLDLYQRV